MSKVGAFRSLLTVGTLTSFSSALSHLVSYGCKNLHESLLPLLGWLYVT